MKQFNLVFDDNEWEALATKKEASKLSWHDFILKCCLYNVSKEVEHITPLNINSKTPHILDNSSVQPLKNHKLNRI